MRPITKIALVSALMIFGIILIVQEAQCASLQSFSNLQTITFLERTGTVDLGDVWTFSKDSTALTTRLSDPMYYSYYSSYHELPQPYDFYGARLYNAYNNTTNYSELYDVFYSDRLGNFDINGEYVTVEAVWPRYPGYYPDTGTTPVGGGLNIAAVYLTLSDTSKVYADNTTSYVAFGGNKVETSYGWATDGSEETATTMGNTIEPGHPDRLRITVGFPSPSEPPPTGVPEPASLQFLSLSLVGLAGMRMKFKK
jgi:hypothetical protein